MTARDRALFARVSAAAIVDDPEACEVFAQVRATWWALPPEQRRRIDLATLPMAGLDENGLIVDALQRCAAVVGRSCSATATSSTGSAYSPSRRPDAVEAAACGLLRTRRAHRPR